MGEGRKVRTLVLCGGQCIDSYLAVVHQKTVGGGGKPFGMMGPKQDRGAASDRLLHHGLHDLNALLVQPGRGFVKDDQPAATFDQARKKRPEQSNTATLSFGKFHHSVLHSMPQPRGLEQGFQFLGSRMALPEGCGRLEVVPNGLIANVAVGLQQHPKGDWRATTTTAVAVPHEFAPEVDASMLEGEEAKDGLNQGGLARPVVPLKQRKGAFFQHQLGPVQHR